MEKNVQKRVDVAAHHLGELFPDGFFLASIDKETGECCTAWAFPTPLSERALQQMLADQELQMRAVPAVVVAAFPGDEE